MTLVTGCNNQKLKYRRLLKQAVPLMSEGYFKQNLKL